jgi:uncharacterized protein YbaR (Trm112 family)
MPHFHKEFAHFRSVTPERAGLLLNCEDSRGDQLTNCQNCFEAYSLRESQECRYVGNGSNSKSCQDCNFFDECELQYFSTNAGPNFNVMFCYLVWSAHDALYSSNCFHSHHFFGCTGLKHHEYCILNKPYSKDEYYSLLARIFKHMRETGEFGKFFPLKDSPFAYNETVAQELYPLTKEIAHASGLQWLDRDSRDYGPATYVPPRSIAEVGDGVVKERLSCQRCGKGYRITTPELAFYRKTEISIPLVCPDCRHSARMERRNIRYLQTTKCSSCSAAIETTVRNTHGKNVLCDTCYAREVG